MPVARKTDPLTSHLAAASVTHSTITATKEAVLSVLRHGPKTDSQIESSFATGMVSPSGLRTRRKELVDEGLVVDTGQKTQLASGRWATVWGVPGTQVTCRNTVGDVTCGMRLKNAVSSATMLEGRCPVHGWQTIPL